jgi:hypothetical protein
MKNAIKVGGNQAHSAFAAAGESEQGRMRFSRILATQLGFQGLRQSPPESEALSWQTPLQQIESGVKLTAIESLLLKRRENGAGKFVDVFYEAAEVRQSRGIRDACATEEDHATFLMGLQ